MTKQQEQKYDLKFIYAQDPKILDKKIENWRLKMEKNYGKFWNLQYNIIHRGGHEYSTVKPNSFFHYAVILYLMEYRKK